MSTENTHVSDPPGQIDEPRTPTQLNRSPRPDRSRPAAGLTERLDPAIGEASAGIGVMMTELVRRTLRGGVTKIEEDIDDLVDEKLTESIDREMPRFELVATQKAELRATEISQAQVAEASTRLGQWIEKVQHHAEDHEERLVGQQKRLDEHAAEFSQRHDRLKGELTENWDHRCREIDERLGKTDESVHETRQEARSLIDQQIDELRNKSRRTVAALKEKLAEQQRITERLVGENQQAITTLAQQSESIESMRQLVETVQADRQSLVERLEQLEAPRGIKALWGKIATRKPKPQPEPAEDETPDETDKP